MNENYLRYFTAFGISYNKNNNSFSFKGEELNEINYHDDINFMSLKEIHNVASIGKNGTLFFRDGDKLSYLSFRTNPYELCYVTDNNNYYLSVYPDMLGNVTVAFSSGDEFRKVDILIGEEHDTPVMYLHKLQEEINDIHVEANDLLIIYAMFSDSRIIDSLTKLMNEMDSTVEIAYNNKINKIKAFYQDKIEKDLEDQKGAINDLTNYYNGFVREQSLRRSK